MSGRWRRELGPSRLGPAAMRPPAGMRTKRGLVERQGGDGRAIHAAITTAGRIALTAAVPRHTQQVRRLVLDRLSSRQIDQLADISRTILDGLCRP